MIYGVTIKLTCSFLLLKNNFAQSQQESRHGERKKMRRHLIQSEVKLSQIRVEHSVVRAASLRLATDSGSIATWVLLPALRLLARSTVFGTCDIFEEKVVRINIIHKIQFLFIAMIKSLYKIILVRNLFAMN